MRPFRPLAPSLEASSVSWLRRALRLLSWGCLTCAVNVAARRLFWPDPLPAGGTAWAFNGGCFVIAQALIWAVRLQKSHPVPEGNPKPLPVKL